MPEQKTSGVRDDRGENVEQEVSAGTPAVAAGGTVEHVIYTDDRDTTSDPSAEGFNVRSVEWSPDATVTGQITNYATVTVEQYSLTGTHKATLGTLAFSAGTVIATANQRKVLIAPGTTECAVGDYLTFKVASTGTGLAIPNGIATIRYSEF